MSALRKVIALAFLLGATVLSGVSGPSRALAAPAIIRGPYIQRSAPTSVIVRWRTDSASVGAVAFGAALDSENALFTESAATTEHRVVLDGLLPDTTYFYTVRDGETPLAGPSADLSFHTHPVPGTDRPLRIWAIGDSGKGNREQLEVLSGFLRFSSLNGPANLVLMLGDNAYNSGLDSEYQSKLFDVYEPLLRNLPLWPAFGNHDGQSSFAASLQGPYFDSFSLPRNGESGGVPSGTEAYYSFDYGAVHFICLDSYDVDRSATAPMAEWLKNDLRSSSATWKIAFFHHPPYSKGSHDSDTSLELREMRENILPLLEDGGVDLVLAGHSHSYERSFLIDGHYGPSTTLSPAMVIDGHTGDLAADSGYHKPAGSEPHRGTIYVVAGNAAEAGGGSLNHPAMFRSLSRLGSLVIDISGSTLAVQAIGTDGVAFDRFSISKDCFASGPCPLLPSATVFPSRERLEWGSKSGDLRFLRKIDRRMERLRTRRPRGTRSYSFSQRYDFNIPAGAGASTVVLTAASRRRVPITIELSISADGVNFTPAGMITLLRGVNESSAIPLSTQLTGRAWLRIRSVPGNPRIDRIAELNVDSLAIR